MRIVTAIVALAAGAIVFGLPAKAQSPDEIVRCQQGRASCLSSLTHRGTVAQPVPPPVGPQEVPVTSCDTYAANDLDPEHKTKGIPFDNLNSALAIPACEGAVRQYPKSPRLIYQLGRAYIKNNDFSRALIQFRKVADQGHMMAQYNLGVMYEQGLGTKKDEAAAVSWYRKAAEQGSTLAQFNLGNIYAKGQGVAKDDRQAVAWYRRAAEKGDANAEGSLGTMYTEGRGVPQNYAEAMKWHRKAADQGNAVAQNNIGFMYDHGLGVPQDHAEAMRWYRKAADEGNAAARNNLKQIAEVAGNAGLKEEGAAETSIQVQTDPSAALLEFEATMRPFQRAFALAFYASICGLRSERYFKLFRDARDTIAEREAHRLHFSPRDWDAAGKDSERVFQEVRSEIAAPTLELACRGLLNSQRLDQLDALESKLTGNYH